MQGQLDEVQTGGVFGDRVLHLEARVHLHEIEVAGGGVEQEFDRRRVLVVGGPAQPQGGFLQGLLLARQQRGRGCLGHQLLEPALDRTVADADGPQGAVVIPLDLDFDMANALEAMLHEDRGVAERAAGLAPGAVEGRGQLRVGPGAANPPPAGAGRRFHEDRVPEPLRVGPRRVERRSRLATPGNHPKTRLLGEALGGDLVAEPAERVARGPDERHAEPVAEFDEIGPLGHEAPPDPCRVGLDRDERLLDPVVVQVGRLPLAVGIVNECRRPEVVRLVGLAHEPRPPVRLGEQGNRGDPGAPFQVELADGVDQTHGGLATIDDGHALEVCGHDDL